MPALVIFGEFPVDEEDAQAAVDDVATVRPMINAATGATGGEEVTTPWRTTGSSDLAAFETDNASISLVSLVS